MVFFVEEILLGSEIIGYLLDCICEMVSILILFLVMINFLLFENK